MAGAIYTGCIKQWRPATQSIPPLPSILLSGISPEQQLPSLFLQPPPVTPSPSSLPWPVPLPFVCDKVTAEATPEPRTRPPALPAPGRAPQMPAGGEQMAQERSWGNGRARKLPGMRSTEEPLCCRARPAKPTGSLFQPAWREFSPKLGIKPAPTHQARSLENISLFGFAEIRCGHKVLTCYL